MRQPPSNGDASREPRSFAAGAFSAAPVCVATAYAGNLISPCVEIYNVSNTSITYHVTAAAQATSTMPANVGGDVDANVFLICVGHN